MREADSQTCQLVAPDPLGDCCFLHHFSFESPSDFVLDLSYATLNERIIPNTFFYFYIYIHMPSFYS